MSVALEPEALQRIAAAVTPAVMVSACGLFALGLDNQIARMANRVRDLAREFRQPSVAPARQEVLRQQMRIVDRRHVLLAWALAVDYSALFTFVVTSLVYLFQGALDVSRLVPLSTFTAGVLLLGAMSVLALASMRLSRASVELETRDIFGP